MMGEYPELPPLVIVQLRAQGAGVRHQAADALWSSLVSGTVSMFEGCQLMTEQE